MIYNVSNTSDVGKPCSVYDANDNEVHPCIEVDTETGRCELFTLDEGGNFVMNVRTDEIFRHIEYRPAPLRIEWVSVK